MKYTIEISYTADEDLKNLPWKIQCQIIRKISRLQDGLIGDIKKLQNFDCDYRLRMGNYRILFDLLTNEKKIVILRIRKRSEAYD